MTDKFQGRTIGPYTLESLLGKGGMGTVYRAAQADGPVVAIKILPVDDASASSTMAARFKREIQACLGTNSVHVIKLFEAGVEPDCHWYSMELLEGKTLQQVMKARGRIPREEVFRICTEISLALDHIHERGIIHRDLKPGNVMIVRGGRTVLMDFGLAKVADRTRITKTGHGLGTPRYMAPEMLLAKPPSPATDVYQLGVILYELVSGATVVKAKSFATLAHELTRVYPPRLLKLDPSISENLDTLVFNCLEKDQKLRYQSAAEFRADLEACQRGEAVERRGHGRTLTLGESSGEIDTAELTAVDNEPPRASPLPRDSRASGKQPKAPSGDQSGNPSGRHPRTPSGSQPRASASFSSVAPATAPGQGVVFGLLEQLRSRGLHRPGVALVGVLLGCLCLGWLFFGQRWSGDRGLVGELAVRTSPAGAEVHFQTVSEVAGAVRVFRMTDQKSREYRTPGGVTATSHSVKVAPLVQGRRYACEVLFPDGVSQHRIEFDVPDRSEVQDVRLERTAAGKPELVFSSPFEVGGHIRQGPPGASPGVKLGEGLHDSWRVPLPLDNPFDRLEDLYLDLHGAAGWQRTFGPYDFPGLDGQVHQTLATVDVSAMLQDLEAGRRSTSGAGSVLVPLREKLQAQGVPAALQRLRPHADGFFTDARVPIDRKLKLFHALQRFSLVDFYCVARNLPPILEVSRLYDRFVRVTRSPSFEGPNSSSMPRGWARLRLSNERVPRVPLLPGGTSPGNYPVALPRDLQGVSLAPRALPQSTMGLTLPSPLPVEVLVSAEIGNFSPEFYLEVRVNEQLTLMLHTPDPGRILRGGGARGLTLEDLVVRNVASLPPAVFHRGRNQVVLSLERLGGSGGGPTWVQELDVYYRRGN